MYSRCVAVPPDQRDEYAALAEQAAKELDQSPAEDILAWAADTFERDLCVASSMGDALMVHMVARALPGVSVLFVDTGYHFPETLGTRDSVAAAHRVELLALTPRQTVAEQDSTFGPDLWSRDPDACCGLRKVEPLARGLEPFHAWVTGLRRDEAGTRRHVGVVEWDQKRSMVKVNPIATWSQAKTEAYMAENGVLVNPLADAGYPSIGCRPCTRAVAPGEDPRSGRWSGRSKTECGIHL